MWNCTDICRWEKGAVRKKNFGTVLTSIDERRELWERRNLELYWHLSMREGSCEKEGIWNFTDICRWEKGAVRKKEFGTVLTSVDEKKQSWLEMRSCGPQRWWNGDNKICSVLLAYWISWWVLKFVHPSG
jgi:beta-glucosidase/6-phospho-beta-glucosidase/beta-galactosidase